MDTVEACIARPGIVSTTSSSVRFVGGRRCIWSAGGNWPGVPKAGLACPATRVRVNMSGNAPLGIDSTSPPFDRFTSIDRLVAARSGHGSWEHGRHQLYVA